MLAYHQTLSSPMFPQPISRPSSSPYNIVRGAIEILTNARQIDCACGGSNSQTCAAPPQPVFVVLDQKKDTTGYEEAYLDDVLEIDLDEDGPLREEYLPRRRTSHRSSNFDFDPFVKAPECSLPPPAKWSPTGDEPIVRDASRVRGQYVAPQALSHAPMVPALPPFPPTMDSYHTSWSMGGYVMAQDPISRPPVFAPPPVFHAPSYEFGYTMPAAPHGHARSHSLSYNQAIADQVPARLRSYSQTRFDQQYSHVRATEAYYVPSHWSTYDRVSFPTSYDRPFGPHHRPSLKA